MLASMLSVFSMARCRLISSWSSFAKWFIFRSVYRAVAMLYIGRIQETPYFLAGILSHAESAASRHGSTSSYESSGSAGPQSSPPAPKWSKTTKDDGEAFSSPLPLSHGNDSDRARRGCPRNASRRKCTSGAGRNLRRTSRLPLLGRCSR